MHRWLHPWFAAGLAINSRVLLTVPKSHNPAHMYAVALTAVGRVGLGDWQHVALYADLSAGFQHIWRPGVDQWHATFSSNGIIGQLDLVVHFRASASSAIVAAAGVFTGLGGAHQNCGYVDDDTTSSIGLPELKLGYSYPF